MVMTSLRLVYILDRGSRCGWRMDPIIRKKCGNRSRKVYRLVSGKLEARCVKHNNGEYLDDTK